MSFEENLAKKKKRKGIAHFIIGAITIFLFSFPAILLGIATDWYCPDIGILLDCHYFFLFSGLGFLFGIVLFIRGAYAISNRYELSEKDKAKLKELNQDEKIKQLEKRLEEVEEDKTKSKDNSENS